MICRTLALVVLVLAACHVSDVAGRKIGKKASAGPASGMDFGGDFNIGALICMVRGEKKEEKKKKEEIKKKEKTHIVA